MSSQPAERLEAPDTDSAESSPRDETGAFPRPSDWLLAELLVGGFFVVYLLLRIVLIDITNDELGALISVYREGFAACLTFVLVDAQNHFLMGMLSIASLKLLPFDELISIRLPSLLAYLLYFGAGWRLSRGIESRGIESRPLGFALFLALSANAFVLDFFALSRGYGLALGLQLVSLAAVIELLRCGETPSSTSWRANLALIAGCLSVLSHLAFLNYFLGLLLVLALLAIEPRWQRLRDGSMGERRATFAEVLGANLYLLYGATVLAAFYTDRVLLMLRGDKFYFGGERGFVADTVQSLVIRTLYDWQLPSGLTLALAFGLGAIVLGIAFDVLLRGWPPAGPTREAAAVALILLTMGAYAVTVHHLFGIKYVIGRAALMFVPLVLCQLGLWAASQAERFAKPVLGFLALSAILGIGQMNITHAVSWPLNADVRELVRDLGELRSTSGGAGGDPQTGGSLTVAVTDDSKSTIWYYVQRDLGLEVDEELANNFFLRQFDDLAVYSPTHAQTDGERTWVDPTHYFFLASEEAGIELPFPTEPVKTYPVSGAVLLRSTGSRTQTLPPGQPDPQ